MGILVLGDMLAPLSFFGKHLWVIYYLPSPIISPCLPCMSIVFNSLGTNLITKRKKKERLCKGGWGGGQTTNKVYYGKCANGECPFQKKKRFLVLKVIFYKIKISALQKKKKSNDMSISQPVTFTLQSKIIFKHGWLL